MSVHRFARLVAGFVFLLILAGGLVTSTSSGLAVPDWPLSYGQAFPPMVGGIRFEHTHRVIAGLVAVLTLILAVWLARAPVSSSVRRVGWAALGAVLAQAVLGGLTVLWHLPPAVSIAHACLAQLFFCLVVAAAVMTSPSWSAIAPAAHDAAGTLRRFSTMLTLLCFCQLVVGASLRHTGPTVAPGAAGSILLWHLALAGLIVFHAALLGRRIAVEHQEQPLLTRPMALLAGLLAAQLALGVGALLAVTSDAHASTQLAWWAVALRTAHVGAGALLLAASLVITLRAHRWNRFSPAKKEPVLPRLQRNRFLFAGKCP